MRFLPKIQPKWGLTKLLRLPSISSLNSWDIILTDNYVLERIPGHDIPLIVSLYYHYAGYGIIPFHSYGNNVENYEDDIIINIVKKLMRLNYLEIYNELLQLKGD